MLPSTEAKVLGCIMSFPCTSSFNTAFIRLRKVLESSPEEAVDRVLLNLSVRLRNLQVSNFTSSFLKLMLLLSLYSSCSSKVNATLSVNGRILATDEPVCIQVSMDPKMRASAFKSFGMLCNFELGAQREAFLEQVCDVDRNYHQKLVKLPVKMNIKWKTLFNVHGRLVSFISHGGTRMLSSFC